MMCWVWAGRFSKFAVCALYIFVYVLSDSMLSVCVLPDCVHSVLCVLTLTVPDFAVCMCALWLYAIWLLAIYVLCAVRMLSMCYPSVCSLLALAVSVHCLLMSVCCLCLCLVCVLSVWLVSVCSLFAVYVCCLSVYVGCLFVSVYADVLVLMWLPIRITFIPIMQRMENLIFYTYIKINLNHHTHLITYIVRIRTVQVFCKGGW